MRRWVSLTPAVLAAAVLAAPLGWTPLAHADEQPPAVVAEQAAPATSKASQAEDADTSASAEQAQPGDQTPGTTSEDEAAAGEGAKSDELAAGENEAGDDSSADAKKVADDSRGTQKIQGESRVAKTRAKRSTGSTSGNQAREAYTGKPPKCNVRSVYAVNTAGAIFELGANATKWKKLKGAGINVGDDKGNSQVNGLAVGRNLEGKDVWYAYQRATLTVNGQSNARLFIYRSVNNETWRHVDTIDIDPYLYSDKFWIPNYTWSPVDQVAIGGAVNPADGSYWILTYTPNDVKEYYNDPGNYRSSGETRARLYRVDAVTGKAEAKGYTILPKFGNGANNGDLYFDAQGNANLVQTLFGYESVYPGLKGDPLTQGLTKIHRIDAGQLKGAGPATKLTVSSGEAVTLEGLEANTGIAFSFPNGKMVVSDLDGSRAFNPSNYGDATTEVGGLDDSQDLASCSFPHTLEVTKDVVDRENPQHQFRLSVFTKTGTDSLAKVDTAGNKKGIQDQKIGPISIGEDQTLIIKETLLNGTQKESLSDYKPTLTCSDASYPHEIKVTPSVTKEGKTVAGSYEVTIPKTPADGSNSMRVQCKFTNDPTPDPATVKVIKKVRPYKGATGGSQDQIRTGWAFTIDPAQGELVSQGGATAAATQKTGQDGSTSWTVRPNGEISLSESLTQGGETLKFVEGSCSLDGSGALPVTFQEQQNGTVKASGLQVKPEQSVACTFINQELPTEGSVKFTKVDAAGKALAGSVWTLTATDPKVDPVNIEDCVADSADKCTGRDRDPKAGSFKVDKITLGKYQLKERSAPAGYILDESEHKFALTVDNPDYVFSTGFVNQLRPPVAVPFTGGTGSLVFTLGGLFALMLAAGVAVKAVRS